VTGRVARRATIAPPTASKSHLESRGLNTPLGYQLEDRPKMPSKQGVCVEVTGFEPATSTMRKSSEPIPSDDLGQLLDGKVLVDGQISLWDDYSW
jgi:hypothetical protein